MKSILHQTFIFNEYLLVYLLRLLRLLFFLYFPVILLDLLLDWCLSLRYIVWAKQFQINLICYFLLSLNHNIIFFFKLLVFFNAFLWNILIQFLPLCLLLFLKFLINWLLLQSFNWFNIFLYFFLLHLLVFISLILLKLFQTFLNLHLFKRLNRI